MFRGEQEINDIMINMDNISNIMRKFGANRIIIKKLANNDNSKQQIYFGSDFSVIKDIPIHEINSSGISKKGAIFKAFLDLFWITSDSEIEQAHGSQIILYPDYPEIRLSGILRGCSISPSHLMAPPTYEERKINANRNRFLIIGICKDRVLCYMSSWNDDISLEIKSYIDSGSIKVIFSVFYEYYTSTPDSKKTLIEKLKEIHSKKYVRSQRLDKNGNIINYEAKNGAGLTLESLFGIIPNGNSGPDFMDWELKAHSKGAVTLMTPEPNTGEYIENVHDFMNKYASNRKEDRLDFASIHRVSQYNKKTKLTLCLDGYDFNKNEIIDPDGGLFLKNNYGDIAAGWSFSKLIDHWKRKHSKTCFVSYSKKTENDGVMSYYFGPEVFFALGSDLKKFISSLASSRIYYDPGINLKAGKVKKRNQFRMKWKDVCYIYDSVEKKDLSID